MYRLTRRDFLRHTRTAGLALLADYLPRFSQSAAIGQQKPYAFEANINLFYGIKVDAELETRVNDTAYFSNFRVFSKGSKNNVVNDDDLVYGHYSEGMTKNGVLLPTKVKIRRNFRNLGTVEYLILWILGYDKIDEFNLNFEYIGDGIKVNLTEKRFRVDNNKKKRTIYEGETTAYYDSPRVDVLTAIIQALTDMKKGKKITDAIEVKLVGKTGGPLTGEITLRENKAAIAIKEDSDFKNMAVVLSKEIEPQEIYMKELYRLADVEAFRRTKVD